MYLSHELRGMTREGVDSFYIYIIIQLSTFDTMVTRDVYIVVYLLHTLRAHKLMKQHMLAISCAHRTLALVHTWCTQKYQKKYSKPLIALNYKKYTT